MYYYLNDFEIPKRNIMMVYSGNKTLVAIKSHNFVIEWDKFNHNFAEKESQN